MNTVDELKMQHYRWKQSDKKCLPLVIVYMFIKNALDEQ